MSGKVKNEINWVVKDGALVAVEGSGPGPVDARVPDGVRRIEGDAFEHSPFTFGTLVVSAGVKELAPFAFRDVIATTIVIENPDIVFETLNTSLLQGAWGWEEVSPFSDAGDEDPYEVRLPEGLREIPDCAMQGERIGGCVIPGSVVRIGRRAFFDNFRLELFVPDTVKEIGEEAFEGVKSVSLSSSSISTPGEFHAISARSDGLKVLRKADSADILETLCIPLSLEDKIRVACLRDGRTTSKKEIVRMWGDGEIKNFEDKIRVAVAMASTQKPKEKHLEYVLKNAKKAERTFATNNEKLFLELLKRILHSAKAAPKKKTLADLIQDVADGLRKGDSTALEKLGAQSKKVKPVTAVSFLELACAYCDAPTVARLYDMFGDFEYTGSALLFAFNAGNEAAVKVLFDHGAAFSNGPKCYPPTEANRKGWDRRADVYCRAKKQKFTLRSLCRLDDAANWAFNHSYLGVDESLKSVAGDRIRFSGARENALRVIRGLMKDGELPECDAPYIFLFALHRCSLECASDVLEFLSRRKLSPSMEDKWNRAVDEGVVDVFTQGGWEPMTAKWIFETFDGVADRVWSWSLVKSDPEVATVAARFVSPNAVKDKTRLLEFIATEGDVDALRSMLGWNHRWSRASLAKAAVAATKAGNHEAAALLIDYETLSTGNVDLTV